MLRGRTRGAKGFPGASVHRSAVWLLPSLPQASWHRRRCEQVVGKASNKHFKMIQLVSELALRIRVWCATKRNGTTMSKFNDLISRVRNAIFHEVADASERRSNGKAMKEIFKDLFDVMKNALIVATVSAAYTATGNIYLFILFVLLLCAFSLHIIGAVMERWSPLPQGMKRTSVLYYVVIVFVGFTMALGVMAFTRSIEKFVLSYSHDKQKSKAVPGEIKAPITNN